MVPFPPVAAPPPLKCSHILKWPLRGDQGLQSRLGPFKLGELLLGHLDLPSPRSSPAQILLPFSRAQPENGQKLPLFLGTVGKARTGLARDGCQGEERGGVAGEWVSRRDLREEQGPGRPCCGSLLQAARSYQHCRFARLSARPQGGDSDPARPPALTELQTEDRANVNAWGLKSLQGTVALGCSGFSWGKQGAGMK